MKKVILFLIYLICCSLSYSNDTNPVFFLEKIIEESKPALLEKDDKYLEITMEKYIDFQEIAIWIVGKTMWFKLDESKKNLFLIELKKLMLKTYSKTVYYYVDADVSFLTPKIDNSFENKKRIQINSVMKKNNKNVSIAYRLIRNHDRWLVYDVLIEGISILKSLKSQYADMIKNKGIDYTINKIKNANKS